MTMKTEQEQIEKMARTMCGYCSTDGKCAVSTNWRELDICANVDTQHCLFKEYAERLIESGYGDVSEYKAEIERLRTTLGQCNTELNSALESLKSQCREIGELKAKFKQAQIDVLNELKKKTHNYYPSIDSYCISQHVVLVRDIDELIKEIENDEN